MKCFSAFLALTSGAMVCYKQGLCYWSLKKCVSHRILAKFQESQNGIKIIFSLAIFSNTGIPVPIKFNEFIREKEQS